MSLIRKRLLVLWKAGDKTESAVDMCSEAHSCALRCTKLGQAHQGFRARTAVSRDLSSVLAHILGSS